MINANRTNESFCTLASCADSDQYFAELHRALWDLWRNVTEIEGDYEERVISPGSLFHDRSFDDGPLHDTLPDTARMP